MAEESGIVRFNTWDSAGQCGVNTVDKIFRVAQRNQIAVVGAADDEGNILQHVEFPAEGMARLTFRGHMGKVAQQGTPAESWPWRVVYVEVASREFAGQGWASYAVKDEDSKLLYKSPRELYCNGYEVRNLETPGT